MGTERFFIVGEESPLYKQYFAYYHEFVPAVRRLYDEFAEKIGIEANKYQPYSSRLGIVPTEADEQKFGGQFTQKKFDGGLRTFKLKSPVNVAWVSTWKDAGLKGVRKPNPVWDLDWVLKGTYRLFDHEGKLYLSMDANYGSRGLPEHLREIKGSEFWQAIEEIEEQQEGAE